MEMFCFDDVELLKETIQPHLPSVLSRELLEPQSFLGIEDLTGEPDAQWPDTCILFAVSQDMNRKINLQDWFDRFFTRVAGTTDSPTDEMLQSRS